MMRDCKLELVCHPCCVFGPERCSLSGAAAARAAGYSESYADKNIKALLNRPAIAAAIAEHRETLKRSTDYDLAAAVAEIDQLIGEARASKQYTAASSLLTTKVKLFGMLIERSVQLTQQVDLAEALREAQARVQQHRPPLLIDGAPMHVAAAESQLTGPAADE